MQLKTEFISMNRNDLASKSLSFLFFLLLMMRITKAFKIKAIADKIGNVMTVPTYSIQPNTYCKSLKSMSFTLKSVICKKDLE